LRTKLLIASLLAAVLVPSAPAQTAPAQATQLMPGVTYSKQVQFTAHGPVVVNVVVAPKPGGLYTLRPVLAAGAVQGVEPLSAMERDSATAGTAIGISGDAFAPSGVPRGVFLQGGVLAHPPLGSRSSLGIDSAGTLNVNRVAFIATWQGTGQRRPFTGLNDPAGSAVVTLYTPAWGAATPARSGGDVEIVLSSFPPATAGGELTGTVVQVSQTGGTPIPAGGAVLVATAGQAQYLTSEAPAGTRVTVRMVLNPSWAGVGDAIGGGPLLVRAGKAVFNAGEAFTTSDLTPREARAAVGQLADGSLLFLAVDGGRPGYSTGMTNFELAQTAVRLGAVTAMAVDPGDSATLAFDGKVLNRPSGPGPERPIGDGLLLLYSGVYAAAPAQSIVSPNGDGIAETQNLSYRIVRLSNVTAKLVGPDGIARFADTGLKQPGNYPFTFTGRRSDGSAETAGRWQWLVTAVDDRGQASSAERDFTLNDTLGFLAVKPGLLKVWKGGPNRLVVSYRLARPARVTVSIESSVGAPVRTLISATAPAGDVAVEWDGLDSEAIPVPTGAYVVRVSATNQIGTVDQSALFRVQRVAPPKKPVKKPHKRRTSAG
jgi:hypothetical protein